MKLKLFPILLSIYFCFSIRASETKLAIKNIVVFGDSLSDNGNYFNASKSTIKPMPLPPYVDGRATNGAVWVEYLAQAIGAKLEDYAYLGALTSGKNPRYPEAIELTEQIDNYLKKNKDKNLNSDNTLYVVWAGANNIFTMDFKKPLQTSKSLWNISGDIIKGVEKLKDKGARYIMVANLPDLGRIALTKDVESYKNMKWVLSTIVRIENLFIGRRVHHFNGAHKDDNIKVVLFDAKSMLINIEKNPTQFFVKNTENSCYVGVPSNTPNPNVACDTPKDHLFWDLVHPSTKIHCFAAYEIQKNLAEHDILNPPNKIQLDKCAQL
ncbi:SGNH/GDSL hydrolase family protein [Silvanigrella aquatica]|uniref:GDSL family lipase n=1 Tax=Silvanigrella aquatica TaxID=1915309 RepID=A0A1L4D2D7_9BACT|nr:SGNH/GDSL hydrolase family protein [Silvanigrella aquatica]APJ04369.1 hypothetical protein AXG55_10810 [Silvanigrella aquatica]